MSLELCAIAFLIIFLEVQRKIFAKRIRLKDAEIIHLETGIASKREKANLPDTVWDKDGNEYHRLVGEFGNDEFMKCD